MILTVGFLGVRGSIPTPAESCLRAGGNTPCLVLRYADEAPVIIDAGTGLRTLGHQLNPSSNNPFSATLLLSHFHWDHIQGFPFFPPIYSPCCDLRLVSGLPPSALKDHLASQMKGPYFPVPFDKIAARCSFEQLDADGIVIGSLRVTPVELHHPGGATGFRINSPAGSIVYVSDHEHGQASVDAQIVRKSEGAGLMIYDAHFTPEEYKLHTGWGHSTWLDGARMAQRAGVSRFALFHHHPNRTDVELDTLVAQCREVFQESFAATEHATITLKHGNVGQPISSTTITSPD